MPPVNTYWNSFDCSHFYFFFELEENSGGQKRIGQERDCVVRFRLWYR